MDVNTCYFYTETIQDFKPLLAGDQMKMVIIDSLSYLTQARLVDLYGYVIMPNHIHLLWYIADRNGKETVAASFAKHTGHRFKKLLHGAADLDSYRSGKSDRSYQFWKRDPLAIEISSERILISKLDYIHNNPVRAHWRLCQYPEEYRWSSARFYYDGTDEFGILKHWRG